MSLCDAVAAACCSKKPTFSGLVGKIKLARKLLEILGLSATLPAARPRSSPSARLCHSTDSWKTNETLFLLLLRPVAMLGNLLSGFVCFGEILVFFRLTCACKTRQSSASFGYEKSPVGYNCSIFSKETGLRVFTFFVNLIKTPYPDFTRSSSVLGRIFQPAASKKYDWSQIYFGYFRFEDEEVYVVTIGYWGLNWHAYLPVHLKAYRAWERFRINMCGMQCNAIPCQTNPLPKILRMQECDQLRGTRAGTRRAHPSSSSSPLAPAMSRIKANLLSSQSYILVQV